MADNGVFIDYYIILQVDPTCSPKELEAAYRHLAKMYHPDHIDTADVTKFNQVIEAYRILRNTEQRAEYDLIYAENKKDNWFKFTAGNDVDVDERSVVEDADAHSRILVFLYKKRRENARNAGIAGFYVQQMLDCSEELMDFHLWYLKEKGFIEMTEQGAVAITMQGIDHVIATSRNTMAEKLLIAQSRDHPG